MVKGPLQMPLQGDGRASIRTQRWVPLQGLLLELHASPKTGGVGQAWRPAALAGYKDVRANSRKTLITQVTVEIGSLQGLRTQPRESQRKGVPWGAVLLPFLLYFMPHLVDRENLKCYVVFASCVPLSPAGKDLVCLQCECVHSRSPVSTLLASLESQIVN